MLRRLLGAQPRRRLFHSVPVRQKRADSVINIDDGTFYRQYPSPTDTKEINPKLFPDLSFSLPVAHAEDGCNQYWAVLSVSSLARTTLLQILAAQHICIPPTARNYPYLSAIGSSPHHGIKYVGFDAERGSNVGGTNVRGAYLSARYESRREETDFCLLDYLTGNTELNATRRDQSLSEKKVLDGIISQLSLRNLLQMPVANLSNGQTRRARIAKALTVSPEVLLLDGPYMGLDPNTLATMDRVLCNLAEKQSPRVIISLRPEDGVPDWITHLLVADENLRILKQGRKDEVVQCNGESEASINETDSLQAVKRTVLPVSGRSPEISKDGWPRQSPATPTGEAVVEMAGVKVAYGDKVVLGNWDELATGSNRQGLWWSLHRGQRCGIFGANGSGKTTMLSLITSDHPQTYSLPIKLFGRSRLPGAGEAGISLFDIQRRMGHSSPEVHAFFPKRLTLRKVLQSAWADAPLARAKLTAEANQRVNAFLRWFAGELNPKQNEPSKLQQLQSVWEEMRHSKDRSSELKPVRTKFENMVSEESDLDWADGVRFGELGFSAQRLALFLRALVATPDLVILDEALSGIDEKARDKALLFLSHGEKLWTKDEPSVLAELDEISFEGLTLQQALLVISHAKEDVPGCLKEWICLPEPGEGKAPRVGQLGGPLELNPQGWRDIWGMS